MIRYALKCEKGHVFDSWFQSADAFDALLASGHLSCAVCGSAEVGKSMMAPRVSSGEVSEPDTPFAEPASDAEKMLAQMRQHVQDNADYVGENFAKEARNMYLGATPERAIYGEANGAEAKALVEDGIPVLPLPFMPSRKAN